MGVEVSLRVQVFNNLKENPLGKEETQKYRENIERKIRVHSREGKIYSLKKKGWQKKRDRKIFNSSDIHMVGFQIYLMKTNLRFVKIFYE